MPRRPRARRVFPVQGGGRYTNDWGSPRSGGRTHEGTDIFAPEGTPVVATEDGVVTKMGPSKVGGNRIWLNGRWYYAHLSRFAPGMRVGKRVRAGQVIGYVGTTGDAKGTPPHLHFGYSPNQSHGSSWSNPFDLLKAMESGEEAPVPSTDVPYTDTATPVDEQPPAPMLPGAGPTPVSPPMPSAPGVGLPGSNETDFQPFDYASSWESIASLPLASPETMSWAERARRMRDG